MRIDTNRPVEAPEGVELNLHVAGPFPRALAWLFDLMLRGCIYFGLAVILGTLGGVGGGLLLIVIFLLEWSWSIYFEVYRGGSTPGKRLQGLQVLQDDGTPVGWTHSSTRNLLRTADILPFGYINGLLSICLSKDFKRIGDRVAGTIVVYRNPDEQLQETPQVAPQRVPMKLSLEEQSAVLEFASRAPYWTSDRQIEVADQASCLTGSTGEKGVQQLLGMAAWIEGSA
jgi:uncharacterized RDD family membrane protein YckC